MDFALQMTISIQTDREWGRGLSVAGQLDHRSGDEEDAVNDSCDMHWACSVCVRAGWLPQPRSMYCLLPPAPPGSCLFSLIVPSADLAPVGKAPAVLMLGGCGSPDRFRGSGASPRTPLWLPQWRGNGSNGGPPRLAIIKLQIQSPIAFGTIPYSRMGGSSGYMHT